MLSTRCTVLFAISLTIAIALFTGVTPIYRGMGSLGEK